MSHRLSGADARFIAELEAGTLTPAEFNHRAHVRAAYVYLVNAEPEVAAERMRATLLTFLERNGVPPEKYHATMTKAWILAVRHFMARHTDAESADAFIDANPQLLDAKIMLTHYSAATLFSPEARIAFVEPDQSPIPRHQ